VASMSETAVTPKLPDDRALAAGLAAALGREVSLVARSTNSYTTSFPTEIATCRVEDGSVVKLLCKYDSNKSDGSYGHRHGVRYEAAVYAELLPRLGATAPRFVGWCEDPASGSAWLALEYLDDAMSAGKVDGAWAMASAARWIGEFQAAGDRVVASGRPPFLMRYDADYFLGWSRRAAENLRSAGHEPAWLGTLRSGFEESVDLLLGSSTVIHGEYYPHNVLVAAGAVRPIDWESVALGAGEIDLASLTERWPADSVAICRREYARARWQGVPPDDFDRRLGLASAYFHLRWLGSRGGARAAARSGWRLEHLHSIGERLELL
jgi:hypothetical protein